MSEIIPVITLYQPWATWIMMGLKTIETRTHNRFKGLAGQSRVGIHAAKKYDKSNAVLKNPYVGEEIINASLDLPTGCLLGTVDIYDYQYPLNYTHEADALIECKTLRHGLFIKDTNQFLQPLPVDGGLGIWYYDLETFQKVKKPQKL